MLIKLGRSIDIQYSLAIWGIAVQTISFGVAIPVFLILHLSTSPICTSLQAADYLVDVPDVVSILPAMVIGFALPTVLVALPAPAILPHDRKQLFIALWQFFPLSVSVLQQGTSFILKALARSRTIPTGSQRQSMRALRVLYAMLLVAAAFSQISTIQLVAISNMFPGWFTLEYQRMFRFFDVFVPKAIAASTKMDSIGSGAHLLLQYDELIGSTSMVLWSLAQFAQIRERTGRSPDMLRVGILSLSTLAITGPLGLTVALVWARDELVFAQATSNGKKKV